MSHRIVIADDHAPSRALVRHALEQDGFTVVAETADAYDAVAAALDRVPDLCLLDIRMPGNGIRAAGVIRAALPDCAIVMLTVSRDDDDLFDALRAGASGYVLKGTPSPQLVASVRAVLEGEAVLSGGLTARLVDEFRGRDRHRIRSGDGRTVRLTAREWEVLEMLAAGLSTARIAERLFVEPVTVRSHIATMLKKLRVPDRQAAVRLLAER